MSDNPYESPNETGDAAKTRSRFFTVGGVIASLAIVLLVIALLLPAKRTAREAARRMACTNNLKLIALALHNYQAANGSWPPAYTVDANGNRLHSWRTLILPYTEESELFETIDLSKPWDDPANAKARETMMHIYQCPSVPLDPGKENLTTYLAVVGPECAFSGSAARKLSEITDGTSNTIAVIDVDSDRAVHWMSPQDIGKDEVLEYGPKSRINHPGVFLAALLDGSVTAFTLTLDPDILHALLTIAGGEAIAD